MKDLLKKIYTLVVQNRFAVLFIAIGIVYFCNLFIDIMDIDAAQYALISMEMSWTKSFLHVFQQGQDYLDKPPLLFWLSSLSFIGLGISNFAYKLPSLLIAILGIYSTYRFASLHYSKEKAILSALILAACQALFLITNDVRTDTNLLGLSMFSIWQLNEYILRTKWKNLILASIGIGGAMLAKGPIALIIPAAAFGTEFLLKQQWKNIFKPQWIILIIIVAIILLPMSYGLYTQFDLHPEKNVYGLQGPSGLRFFYWTQSFGRITGENYWSNDAGYFYFFHTILWDFQPWVLLFIPALFIKIGKLINIRKNPDQEFISLGGFVLVFIALSMSHYKLPHYIFVLFPFASIITANFIYELKEHIQARVAKIQFGIMHLLWLIIGLDLILFFPAQTLFLPLLMMALYILNVYVFKKLKGNVERIIIPTLITTISFNLMMAVNFYPNLLSYQAGSQVGKYVTENKIPENKFYHYQRACYSLDFYARRITPAIGLSEIANLEKGTLIFTTETGYQDIIKEVNNIKVLKEIPSFKVTALKFPFLNRYTRAQALKKEFILEIQ